MSVIQYIGARYVPKFFDNPLGGSDWAEGVIYEPLTVVTYMGGSYTSKKTVPATVGAPNLNLDYWAPTGNYNAQIEEIVTGFDNLREEVTENLTAMDEKIENTHLPYIGNATNTYIDGVNGDDDTAELDSSEKPFKTLAAAWKKSAVESNDFRFTFVTAGNYTLPARVISGCVIHFNSLVDGVHVYADNDYGNLFFYDCHVNIRCEDTNGMFYLHAANSRQITFEGSTFWLNRVVFECAYLYGIQGSMNAANVVVNGYVNLWFSLTRLYNVEINTNEGNIDAALNVMCGTLRIENQPLKFGANVNGNEIPAIRIRSGQIRINNNLQCVGNTYLRVLQADSSLVLCSDVYWDNLTAQGLNGNTESSLADNSIRSRSAQVLPV